MLTVLTNIESTKVIYHTSSCFVGFKKNFGSRKILVKKFGSKKILGEKKLGLKSMVPTFLVTKKFEFKRIWIQYGLIIIFGSKKMY